MDYSTYVISKISWSCRWMVLQKIVSFIAKVNAIIKILILTHFDTFSWKLKVWFRFKFTSISF